MSQWAMKGAIEQFPVPVNDSCIVLPVTRDCFRMVLRQDQLLGLSLASALAFQRS